MIISNNTLSKIEKIIASLLFGMVFFIVIVGVIARYVFIRPIYWIEEASNFLFVWTGFLACAYALGNKRHIRISFFIASLPLKLQKVANILILFLLQILFVLLINPTLNMLKGLNITAALRLPEIYVYSILVITIGLFIVHNSIKIYYALVDLIRYKGK